MTEETKQKNDALENVADTAKSLVEKGNARHIVVRDANGKQLVELTVTTAALVGFVMLFMQPFSTMLVIGAVIYGLVGKLRIEIVQDVDETDDTITLEK